MEQELILYNSADGKSSVSLLARDGSVWLNQMQLAELFATSVPNISQHINNILKDKELTADSVIKNYLTTATDGKPYQVKFYSLEMILAVGFRVRSIRGVQFRQWANRNLAEYLRKGFVIDDERLKIPMAARIISTNFSPVFAIFEPRKSDFIKRCAICLP